MRAWIAHRGLYALVHVGAWAPLALIIVDYARDALTVNPIQAILSRTGKISLVLLVITLACTPLSTAASAGSGDWAGSWISSSSRAAQAMAF